MIHGFNPASKFCKFDYAQFAANQFFLSGHDYLLFRISWGINPEVSDHSFFSKVSSQVRLPSNEAFSTIRRIQKRFATIYQV